MALIRPEKKPFVIKVLPLVERGIFLFFYKNVKIIVYLSTNLGFDNITCFNFLATFHFIRTKAGQ